MIKREREREREKRKRKKLAGCEEEEEEEVVEGEWGSAGVGFQGVVLKNRRPTGEWKFSSPLPGHRHAFIAMQKGCSAQ